MAGQADFRGRPRCQRVTGGGGRWAEEGHGCPDGRSRGAAHHLLGPRQPAPVILFTSHDSSVLLPLVL